MTTCSVCTKPGLFTCSKCSLAPYCGKDCQLAHWKASHKAECFNAKSSNGNNLTSAAHLLAYIAEHPLALFDKKYITSYMPLLAAHRAAVLDLFGKVALTATPKLETLGFPFAHVFVRHMELDAELQLASEGTFNPTHLDLELINITELGRRAAERGDWYSLCPGCDGLEENGLQPDPTCCAMSSCVKNKYRNSDDAWGDDAVQLVCCFANQVARNCNLDDPAVMQMIRDAAARARAARSG
jgi:hypothetical protein